jgi:hypothetical protein
MAHVAMRTTGHAHAPRAALVRAPAAPATRASVVNAAFSPSLQRHPQLPARTRRASLARRAVVVVAANNDGAGHGLKQRAHDLLQSHHPFTCTSCCASRCAWTPQGSACRTRCGRVKTQRSC